MKSKKLFCVFKNGKPMMSTNYESCIPSREEIKAMKAAGYKIVDNRKKNLSDNVVSK